MPETRRRLRELLLEHSIRFGEFTLSSGVTSKVYIDVKSTSLLGEGATLLGSALSALALDADGDARAVGGLTLGAGPLVTAMAIAAHGEGRDLAAMIVRKKPKGHGTDRYVEAPPTVKPASRVIAVDDVITTAGSTLQAVERLRAEGYVVEHAVCVVDRQAGGEEALREAGVELHSLFRLDEFMD